MGTYQVLFSGEVAENASVEAVQKNLARLLELDERKARTLFSGRTVVVRSQLSQEEAYELQAQFADLGAVCRVKDLTPKKEAEFKNDHYEADRTLRDITAAHLECPRCGHMQLDSSHCARCGVDLVLAMKKKRKEDLIIAKKIRELRSPASPQTAERHSAPASETPPPRSEKGLKKVTAWFRKPS